MRRHGSSRHLSRVWPSRRGRFRLSTGLLALLSAFCIDAHANLQATLANHRDGMGQFDAREGPGLDQGPDNGIVRSHDGFQYRLTLSPLKDARDVVVELTLPAASQGQAPVQWAYVPPGCLRAPVSGQHSTLSADSRTLSCRLGELHAGHTSIHYFEARVVRGARHGDRIPPPAVRISAGGGVVEQPVMQARPLTVSAAPFYDVRLYLPRRNGSAAAPTSGPKREDGLYHRVLVGLLVRNPHHGGLIGTEQLDATQPVEIDLDISGYPPSVRLDDWRHAAGAPTRDLPTASFGDGCGSPLNGSPSRWVGSSVHEPYIQDTGPAPSRRVDAVANGGDCRTLSSDRNHVRIALTGIDSSLEHIPSRTNTQPPGPVPAGEFWVANKAVVLWTPLSDYPVNTPVEHVLRVNRVSGTSVSGQALQGDDTRNNSLRYIRANWASSETARRFVPDNSLPVPLATVGDPNSGGDRVNQMRPGQTVGVSLDYFNNGTATQHGAYLCEIIDRSAFDIGPRFKVSLTGQHRGARIRYGARAQGTPYFDSTDSALTEHDPLGPGPADNRSDYGQARCDDPGIRWFNTPAEAQAAGGLVFVRGELNQFRPNHRFGLNLSGLILRETWASTLRVHGSRGPDIRQAGAPIAADTILQGRAEIGSRTLPDPGRLRQNQDHLRVINSQTLSRIQQSLLSLDGAPHRNPVAVGTTLRHRLQGRYSSTVQPVAGQVTISSILPAGLEFVTGSAELDGQPHEPQLIPDAPGPGQTTLRWVFPNRMPHAGNAQDTRAHLPVLEFQSRLSRHVRNGSTLHPVALISGGPHDAEADCQPTTDLSVLQACAKASVAEIRTLTPSGFTLENHVSTPLIEPGDSFDSHVRFTAGKQALHAPELPDVILLLPFVGDGQDNPATGFRARHPASDFVPGAFQLHGVFPPAIDPGAQVYYTRQPPGDIHSDPRHPGNRMPDGETRWCPAEQLGSAGCPAGLADVTALRIRPALDILPPDRPYEIRLRWETDPALAGHGSRFASHASAGPYHPGSPLPLIDSSGSQLVQVSLNPGGLRGRSFVDPEQDNRFEAHDTALAGQCINLTGQTAKGRAVRYSTRTDAQGSFAFIATGRDSIHRGTDCQGKPLPRFAGLAAGEYTLSRPETGTDARRRPGALHAGKAGGHAGQHRIEGIRLAAGTEADGYHFTEAMVAPTLKLQAIVLNQHGGRAVPGDFLLQATARPDAQQPTLESHGDAQTGQPLPAGRYRLGHRPRPGYRASSWQCRIDGGDTMSAEEISLDHGEQASCSLTLMDMPARLTLVNTLDIRHGRPAAPEDFRLEALAEGQTSALLSGTTGMDSVTGVPVPAGRYQLDSHPVANFHAGPWRCDIRRPDGETVSPSMDLPQVELDNGDAATCRITHTDAALRLSLDQVTVEAPDGSIDTTLDTDNLALQLIPVSDRRRRIRLHPGDAVSEALVSGEEYELLAPVRRGYHTLVSCHGADNRPLPLTGNRLRLDDNTSCRLTFRQLPADIGLSHAVHGGVRAVAGSRDEYEISYRVDVRHEGGGDGHYDLIDTPAFDPDVEILGLEAHLDGQKLALESRRQPDGRPSWQLASGQPLGIDEQHTYLLTLRVRVPLGSDTRNDRCRAGQPGHGLYHQVELIRHQGVASFAATTEAAGSTRAAACADTPVPRFRAAFAIEKTGHVRSAELGDLVAYQVRLRHIGDGPALQPVLIDQLPAGFRLEPGSIRVQGARLIGVQHQQNGVIRFSLGRIEAPAGTRGTSIPETTTASPAEVVVRYRARIGTGAQEGDGINRAHVVCAQHPDGGQRAICSNESRWKVEVRGGVFGDEVCLAGQVFVDCDGNSRKDAEEPGIPGVRLYLQNGTWMQTDADGRYSHCGLRPRTHVLKVDSRTLPRRSRLVTSSAQNAGDAQSLFIDARKGLLHRADFVEGSCSAAVLRQVEARRTAGETHGDQSGTQHPAITFQGRRMRMGIDG